MESHTEAILRLAPRIDLLHDVLGIGRFAEVTITADGWFVGRARGDIGFNDVLGLPSPPALARARTLFLQLSPDHQAAVIADLHARGIPPQALGLPILSEASERRGYGAAP